MTRKAGANPAAGAPGGDAEARRGPRWRLRTSPAVWALIVYLVVVTVLTALDAALDVDLVRELASTPDRIASARVWLLATSGLLVDGPTIPQVVATAVLGVVAIRLAGGRVFWSAAALGHILGTLLVYAGVWIADLQSPSSVAALLVETDFGISLVWCAALGVLAAVAWWRVRPLGRWQRLLAAAGAPAALVVVTVFSTGLARYEHAAAFLTAVGLVFIARRWGSVGRLLRLGGAIPG